MSFQLIYLIIVCLQVYTIPAALWYTSSSQPPFEQVIWWPIYVLKFIVRSFIRAVFTG